MTRHWLFLILSLISMISYAEERDISSRIKQAYQLAWGDQENEARFLISGITESDIVNLSDSTRYMFYYTNAGVYYSNNENQSILFDYLNKAIKIRESSIGVQDAEYLELLWGKGSMLEDTDPAGAMKAYQKGFIVSSGFVNTESDSINKCFDEILENLKILYFELGYTDQAISLYKEQLSSFWFGKILEGLGRLYYNRGYTNQAISLYREGFTILKEFYEKDNSSEIWGILIDLETLLYQEKRFDEAIEVCNELLQFFLEHDAKPSHDYALVLNLKGNTLREAKKYSESINCYYEAIEMLKGFNLNDAGLESPYGNLYVALIKHADYEQAAALETEIIPYFSSRGNIEELINYFYTASNICIDRGDWDKAEQYISKCSPYMVNLESNVKEVILSRLSVCRLNQEDLDGAIDYKRQAITVSEDILTQFKNRADLCYLISLQDPYAALTDFFVLKNGLQNNNLVNTGIYVQIIDGIINIYHTIGDFTDAIAWLKSTLEYVESIDGTDYLSGHIQNNIGVCYLRLNDPQSAMSYFINNKSILEKLEMTESIDFSLVLHNIGRSYMLLGDDEKAKENLLAAQTLQIKLNGVVYERTAQYLNELGIDE